MINFVSLTDTDKILEGSELFMQVKPGPFNFNFCVKLLHQSVGIGKIDKANATSVME